MVFKGIVFFWGVLSYRYERFLVILFRVLKVLRDFRILVVEGFLNGYVLRSVLGFRFRILLGLFVFGVVVLFVFEYRFYFLRSLVSIGFVF